MSGFKKDVIGLFLATTSNEDFQSYRLYNSILYLHRNGVDLSAVSSLFLLHSRSPPFTCIQEEKIRSR